MLAATSSKSEQKARGMSDVDDTNLRALQSNTSTMIDLQLSRMKSTKRGDTPQSPAADNEYSPKRRGGAAAALEDDDE